MSETEVREGWHWPAKDKGAWEWCYERWRTLPETITQYVTNFDICVHAGANVGLYAKDYAKLFRRVIAVEPEPTNFWCLTQNVPERNVAKLNAALGMYPSWVGLFNPSPDEINCGGWKTTYDKDVDYGYITPVLKIDDFAGDIGLIHLDVEGAELDVLKGAEGVLTWSEPVVCLETIGHGDDAGAKAFLERFGYEVAEVLEHDTIYRKT